MNELESTLKELNIDLYNYERITDQEEVAKYQEMIDANLNLPAGVVARSYDKTYVKEQYKYRSLKVLPRNISGEPKQITSSTEIQELKIYKARNGKLPDGIFVKKSVENGLSVTKYFDDNHKTFYELKFHYFYRHNKDNEQILLSLCADQATRIKKMEEKVKSFENLLIGIAIGLVIVFFAALT